MLVVARRRLLKPPASVASSGGTFVDLGTTDWRYYLRLGEGNWIVPNLTYTAGDIFDGVAGSAGSMNGWRTYRPVTMGSATIDQSPPGTNIGGGLTANGDLNLSGTSKKILMAGFNFRNGILTVDCPKVRLWYTDHTFPAATWIAETNFASKLNYHHWGNRLIETTANSDGFEVMGSNLHDGSTCYYPQAGARNHALIGCDFYNVSNGGYYGDAGGDHGTHPDCCGMVGGNYNFMTFTDCHMHPGTAVGGIAGMVIDGNTNGSAHGPVNNLVISRTWLHGGSGAGLEVGAASSGSGVCLAGTPAAPLGTDVHTWGWTDGDYIQWLDDTQVNFTFGTNPYPTRVFFNPSSSNAGVAQTGTDPATAWRAISGHGSTDFLTYFSGNWP